MVGLVHSSISDKWNQTVCNVVGVKYMQLLITPLTVNHVHFYEFRSKSEKSLSMTPFHGLSFQLHAAGLIRHQKKWRERIWHQSLYHLQRKRHFARRIITCRPESLSFHSICRCTQISSPSWHLLMSLLSSLKLLSLGRGGGGFLPWGIMAALQLVSSAEVKALWLL